MTDTATPLGSLPLDVQAQAASAALNATDNSVTRLEESTPSTSTITVVFWVLKVIGLVGGGYLVSHGIDVKAWTDSNLMLIAGVVVAVGTGVWSFISSQIIRPWREHQIALASASASAAATAAAGKPVQVPVQPPPAKV